MATQVYTRIPCHPCSTTELDLENVPPTQVAITDDYVVSTGPKSALDSQGPLEFEFASSGDDYLDLGECYLKIKFKIRNQDGSKLTYYAADNETHGAQMPCQPVNLMLHSMFKQVDVIMNETRVSSSNDTYAYRAYLTTLLSYSHDAKLTWLQALEGWWWDDAGEYDLASNNAAYGKVDKFKGGRSCELKGRLHVDMCHQGRLIPNNVSVRIVLTRSRQEFFMMSFAAAQQPFQITLEAATLEARRVKLAPAEQLRLEKILASPSGALYPVTHVVTKHFTLATGSSTIELDSLFVGQIPNKIVLGMVRNDAFSGSYSKNPYNFQHFDLSFVDLNVEGKQIPNQGLNANFEQGQHVDCYFQMAKACGVYPANWSNHVTTAQYIGGCTLFCFDLTPDDGGDGVAYVTPRRYGTVRANLRFHKPLPTTVTLIVFAQYDNMVMIDRNRTVTFDYTV